MSNWNSIRSGNVSELYKFMEEFIGCSPCKNIHKYSQEGNAFCFCTEEIEGIYWFYEAENFFIDIHDFFIKKESVKTNFPDMSRFMSFCSAYIITASGESFHPYQQLSANSLYITDISSIKQDFKFLLHENFPYLSVGINFKKQMIDECLASLEYKNEINFTEMFFDTKTIITNSLEVLAKSIINCKMTSPAAELFFEAKAKEWLSITIDAFLNRNTIQIPIDDEKALENVANYLNDHYALDVSQKTLEEIAMMSGTKLKKLFKQKYQLSITEYSQRRRMNIAEILLLNSTLDIKDVAESVGYSSHSKFSSYFKKYKGMYPRELKKIASKHNAHSGCLCDDMNAKNNIK